MSAFTTQKALLPKGFLCGENGQEKHGGVLGAE